MTNRRKFVGIVGLIPLVAVRSVVAQLTNANPRIAFIEAGSAAANRQFADAFERGLRDLGYVNGRNIVIETRWADSQAEGFRRALSELIGQQIDVIVVTSGVGAIEAKRATASIPVIFVGVADPVGNGLVASLAHPGSNLTGLTTTAGEGLFGKSVQVLKEIGPGSTRLAILWNPTALQEPLAQISEAARKLALDPLPVEARNAEAIPAAFESMRKDRANALFVVTDPVTLANRETITTLARAYRLPSVYTFAEFVRSGGLVAYAPNIVEQLERAATYVDRILRGSKPQDLPIEQPTKFDIVINLRTAKALGLAVPQGLLLRANEVIQ